MKSIPEVSRVDFIVNLFSGGGRKRDFLDLYAQVEGGQNAEQSNQSEKELGSRQEQITITCTKLPFKITGGGLNARPLCPSEVSADDSVHTDGVKRDLWLAGM